MYTLATIQPRRVNRQNGTEFIASAYVALVLTITHSVVINIGINKPKKNTSNSTTVASFVLLIRCVIMMFIY